MRGVDPHSARVKSVSPQNGVDAAHRRRRGIGGPDRPCRKALRLRFPEQGLHPCGAGLLRGQRRAPRRPVGRQGSRHQVLRRHRHLLSAAPDRGLAGSPRRSEGATPRRRPGRPGRGQHHAPQPAGRGHRASRDLGRVCDAAGAGRGHDPGTAERCPQGDLRDGGRPGRQPRSYRRRVSVVDGRRPDRRRPGPPPGRPDHLSDPGRQVHRGDGDAGARGRARRGRARRL